MPPLKSRSRRSVFHSLRLRLMLMWQLQTVTNCELMTADCCTPSRLELRPMLPTLAPRRPVAVKRSSPTRAFRRSVRWRETVGRHTFM